MATHSYAVDVSGNQPAHQDWKSFGVHMGIAKASEGQRSRDAWFARHIADIKAAGLVRGGYHFAWPNQGASAEADNYITAVKPFAGSGFVHILDLEPYSEKPGVPPRNYAGRTDAQIRNYATAWVTYVKSAFPGQRVLVYTPGGNYARHYPANSDGYWYPAYPVQGRSFAAAAALPRPSAGNTGVWGWQFASVPRDQTVIYLSPEALRTWAGIKPPAPPVPPAPKPEVPVTLTDADAAVLWNHLLVSETAVEGTDPHRPAGTFLTYGDVHYAQTMAAIAALSAKLDALTAAVAVLNGKVSS